MFRKNSALQHTYVPVDAGPRSGHRWGRLNGFLKIQKVAQAFTLPLGIGSIPANPTIGYAGARLFGASNGRLKIGRASCMVKV